MMEDNRVNTIAKSDVNKKEKFNKNERKNNKELIINEVMNYNDEYLKAGIAHECIRINEKNKEKQKTI